MNAHITRPLLISVAVLSLIACAWADDQSKKKETIPLDFLPHSLAPETDFLDLGGTFAEKSVPVWYKRHGASTWAFPVFAVEKVEVTRDQLAVRVRDCLNDPVVKRVIEEQLRAKYTGDALQLVVPSKQDLQVGLYINSNGRREVIASQTVSRATGQRYLPLKPFPLDDAAIAQLQGERVKFAGLVFAAPFYGKFAQNDLTVTSTVSRTLVQKFKSALSSDPRGQKATLLVAFGGTVDQEVAIQHMVKSEARVQISIRKGASVAPELLKSIIDSVFAGLSEGKKFDASMEREVVTFVFSNGMRATAAIGTFKNLSDEEKKEFKRKIERTDYDKSVLDGKVKVEGSFLGTGGGVEAGLRTENEKNRIRNHATEDLKEFHKVIGGELPVAALNGKQIQEAIKRSEDSSITDLNSFTHGQKQLEFDYSFDLVFSSTPRPEKPKVTPEARTREKKALTGDEKVRLVLEKFNAQDKKAGRVKTVQELWQQLFSEKMSQKDKQDVFEKEHYARYGGVPLKGGRVIPSRISALRLELFGEVPNNRFPKSVRKK